MQTDPPAIVTPADTTLHTPNPVQPKDPADALATLNTELETTRQTLATIRRERDIHKALFEAGVNDLDIGAVLIERATAAAPDRPIADLVGELKKHKPGLFARATPHTPSVPPTRPATGAMGARTTPEDPKQAAAERAAAGDRGSLLTYLRLRRAPA